MKKLGLSVTLLIALLLSHNVAADSRHWNAGFNNGRGVGNHFRGNNRNFIRHTNRNFRGARGNDYHFGRAGGRRDNGFVDVSWNNRFINRRLNNNRFGHNRFNHRVFNNRGFNNRGFNNRNFNNRGFNNRIFYNHSFYNRGFGVNRFGQRNRWGNDGFVGGLVVGSLLGSAAQSVTPVETVRYSSAPMITNREVIRVKSASSSRISQQPRRRLLRDLQGDCYEIEISPNGDELRSQIDPSFCSF